ncbi:universal stress protein [Vibrio fluvialis]|jgi:nucleotide-binding universal stress UspA family protein|uniref:Universal stress protein n=1 Tax=Vibrio fluvialis TaxID=676 RepID=A0AAX2LSY3_VIBFL|nr:MULTISPECIES: universal stress protein [Vibrio]MCG6508166.1 universal stress protein [Vibrio parahaemolyticus]TNF18697.1 MAG: universal stress global response regulator UspA [Vibrionaceae bacterium]HDM8035325.1 universal stress protein [Vibrio fluvialis clinical-1]AMF93104.1 universal stress global response regulator UspA [Vibrio fluvialis]AVH33263.1 universal stress global response regulator UspA [Vibrio fluvialis]
MKYQHILVALELSDDSKPLIDKAVSFAEVTGADVSFIHIDGTIGEIYKELIDIQADPNQKPLNDRSNKMLKSLQQYSDFPIKHFYVGTGDLSDKLGMIIADNGFDLLICGHHHDFVSKLVSYSRHLINKSPIDILVVPI